MKESLRNTKLTCHLKHESNQYLEAYWIKYKKNCVICGFHGNYWSALLQKTIHCHLTYPKDGKIHYSYKHEASNNTGEELYITAFTNIIKSKLFIRKQKLPAVSYEGKCLLNHLLPNKNPLPLENYRDTAQVFQFPVIAFTFPLPTEAAFFKYANLSPALPKNTDIIIAQYPSLSGVLNIHAFIAGDQYKPDSIKSKQTWITTKTIDGLQIGIIACLI